MFNIKKLPKKLYGRTATLCFISFLLGALHVLTMPPYSYWGIIFVSFGLLYSIIRFYSQNSVQAFLYGYFFGLGQFIFGLYWIGNALLVEGNEKYLWLWPFAVIALPIFLSIYTGLSTAIYKRFFYDNRKRASELFAFVALLSLSEFARGHLFTGLPWNLAGYAWGKSTYIMQISSIGGIYFLSLLTIFWGCLPAYILLFSKTIRSKIILTFVFIVSIVLSIIYGHHRIHNTGLSDNKNVAIQIVQPNIPQAEKWDHTKIWKNFTLLVRLSYPQPHHKSEQTYQTPVKTRLIIWPETAVTSSMLENQYAKQTISEMMNAHREENVYLITGILSQSSIDSSNSLIVLDKKLNEKGKYDKSHLVPFGEYIPFEDHIPLDTITGFSGFVAGKGSKNIEIAGLNFSPIICYEVIFSGNITPKKENKKTDLIVNVTNDAWYGDSNGPRQHFTMARFRAIEEGKPLVRVANTGISGLISATGTIEHKIPLGVTQSHTLMHIPNKTDDTTLFSLLGIIPYILCILIFIAPAILKK